MGEVPKRRWSDVSDDSTDVGTAGSEVSSESDSEELTTLLIKHICPWMRRSSLLCLLQLLGLGAVDFLYLPLDLRKQTPFGFAVVNFSYHEAADEAKRQLASLQHGFEVEWSSQQGLTMQIERYRNSPI